MNNYMDNDTFAALAGQTFYFSLTPIFVQAADGEVTPTL